MARKSTKKTSKKKTTKKASTRKAKNKKVQEPVVNSRREITKLYASMIGNVESKTKMVSNTVKYLDPLTTGNLCLDWAFNGGIFNGMASVAGPEQSGKSTACNHLVASAIQKELAFISWMDAEGTLNPDLSQRIFERYGVSLSDLEQASPDGVSGSPWNYYRENVIEKCFNYMHQLLKVMPDKVWSKDDNTWVYVFKKRDKVHSAMMDAYGVKPVRSLTTDSHYGCPTDYSGVEGGFVIDSFAAMVTERDDENEEKSRIRAAEASAYSEQIRRVSARLSSKGVLLFGTNQLRISPNATAYSGPAEYEPGGEALKFFTGQRARFRSRASGWPTGVMSKYDKEAKRHVEESIFEDSGPDMYDYKHVKNTKNKPGNPNKETWVRVWVADETGEGSGFDPVFDVFNYLKSTKQLVKDKKKWKFNLRPSVGTKKANALNSLESFSFMDLKTLVIAEARDDNKLAKHALESLGVGRKIGLRESLFGQMKVDSDLMSLKSKKKDKDEDDFDGDIEF